MSDSEFHEVPPHDSLRRDLQLLERTALHMQTGFRDLGIRYHNLPLEARTVRMPQLLIEAAEAFIVVPGQPLPGMMSKLNQLTSLSTKVKNELRYERFDVAAEMLTEAQMLIDTSWAAMARLHTSVIFIQGLATDDTWEVSEEDNEEKKTLFTNFASELQEVKTALGLRSITRDEVLEFLANDEDRLIVEAPEGNRRMEIALGHPTFFYDPSSDEGELESEGHETFFEDSSDDGRAVDVLLQAAEAADRMPPGAWEFR